MFVYQRVIVYPILLIWTVLSKMLKKKPSSIQVYKHVFSRIQGSTMARRRLHELLHGIVNAGSFLGLCLYP